ncbi:MAG: PriCT-2 domain-containing protein [Leptothrix sp. (in: b-proteobacteria)]
MQTDTITLDIAEQALQHIPPDQTRSEWARIALALIDEFGDAAFEMWDRWSQGGASYKASDARSTWKSLMRQGGTSRATIGTLVYIAKASGWRMPTSARTRRSAEEMARLNAEREARRAAQDRAAHEAAMAAADRAKKLWDSASPAPADHPYLVRKGISPEGLRVTEWNADIVDEDTGEVYKRRVAGALLIPIWSGPGRISSLQGVFPSADNKLKRDKDYLRDGRKRGGYCVIGKIVADTHTIIICEGYATGWSLHAATSWPVVVAFDAGNLLPVAEALRAKLGGARLIIAADNDQWHADGKNPGIESAGRAAEKVAGIVAVPHFADTTDEPTDFNDLHQQQGLDAVLDQINGALAPKPEPEPEPAPPAPAPGEPPAPPAPAPALAEPNLEHNTYFTILGYDHDRYYLFQHERRQISTYTKGDFGKSGLIELAPIDWWEMYFPGKQGMDANAAMNWLIRIAGRRGIYDISRVHGRGAWVDDGRIVYHHGSSLTVDGEMMDVTQIRSRYVYELDRPLPDPAETPMGSDEGEMILDLAARFRWRTQGSAALVSGWVALAPICGALKWRPHIWIAGGAGAGKSTVLNDFVYFLTGGCALFAQGNSTEAGIRQTLRADALPVLYDESEQNTEQERQRVQSIIALIRQSSTESQARTLKGTAGGEAMGFHIRSMFCLASIQVGLRNQADIERMSQLNLRPKHEDKDPSGSWQTLNKMLAEMNSDSDLPARLLRRSIDLLPVTLKNIKVFCRAASERFGSVRDGDQLGTLLAGAWSLQSTEVASHDEAMEWIDRYDWSEIRDQSDTDTSEDALAALMERQVRVGNVNATVYELVREARGLANKGMDVGQSAAEGALARVGLKASKEWLCVSNKSQALQDLMRGTAYEQDLRGLLGRIKGADRNDNKPIWFAGGASKVVRIPLEKVLGREQSGDLPF